MNTTVIKVISIGAIVLASGASMANTSLSNGVVTIKNWDKSIGSVTVFYRQDYRHSKRKPTVYGQEGTAVLKHGEQLRIRLDDWHEAGRYKYFGVEVYKIKAQGHKAISVPADFGYSDQAGGCSYAFHNNINNNKKTLNVSWIKHHIGCSYK